MKKLFHKDVYMPNGVQESVKGLQKIFNTYYLSSHFLEHINNQFKEDRSHTYLGVIINECLKTIKDNPQEAFEVELEQNNKFFKSNGWFVTKYCIRLSYNELQDLVVVIRPKYKFDTKLNELHLVNNMVVTAWLNCKTDNHITLDDSKYSKNL